MPMPKFTDSILVNAAALNALTNGINNLNTLLTGAGPPKTWIPAVASVLGTTQTISNNTNTLMPLANPSVDNDGMWKSGDAFLTIKTAGVYVATGQARFDAAPNGTRIARILLNGTSVSANSVAAAARLPVNFRNGNLLTCVSQPMSLAVGATLYFVVYQNSGGNLALQPTYGGSFLAALRYGT